MKKPTQRKTANQTKFETLLPQWMEAYRKSWGKEVDDIPFYSKGWVRFPGMYRSKLRVADFEKSTERLKNIAKNGPK